MGELILKRLIGFIPTLLIISIISFVIIQLPPGDFLTSYVAQKEEMGEKVSAEQLARMRDTYNLNGNMASQYGNWMAGLCKAT